jgi:hypothetical protein
MAMKGHLEIFEHRLKNMVSKLAGIERIDVDQAFLEFEQELGNTIPFYDVQSGSTLADYYASTLHNLSKRN